MPITPKVGQLPPKATFQGRLPSSQASATVFLLSSKASTLGKPYAVAAATQISGNMFNVVPLSGWTLGDGCTPRFWSALLFSFHSLCLRGTSECPAVVAIMPGRQPPKSLHQGRQQFQAPYLQSRLPPGLHHIKHKFRAEFPAYSCMF